MKTIGNLIADLTEEKIGKTNLIGFSKEGTLRNELDSIYRKAILMGLQIGVTNVIVVGSKSPFFRNRFDIMFKGVFLDKIENT